MGKNKIILGAIAALVLVIFVAVAGISGISSSEKNDSQIASSENSNAESSEGEMNTETNQDSDADVNTGTENGTGPETDSSSETDTSSESDTESEKNTESESNTGSESSTESESDTGSEDSSENESNSESGSNTGAGSNTESESEDRTDENQDSSSEDDSFNKDDTSNEDDNNNNLTFEDYDDRIEDKQDDATTEEVKLARAILAKIIKTGMSDYEKVKAINDYMILNVRYDRENYATDTIPASCFTSLGAMRDGVAVCAGYAKMFNLLCHETGLESTYVVGSANGYHAWNQVKVDGNWYNIDVTWNDPDCERHDDGHYYCGCYQYFLISDELFHKSHNPHGETESCSKNLDTQAIFEGCPYSKERESCMTQEELNAVVKDMVKNNETSKDIVVLNKKDLKNMVVEALKECKIYDSSVIDVSQSYTIYREETNWYNVNLQIEIEESSIEDLIIDAATTEAEVKTRLEKGFEDIQKYGTDTNESFKLYVTDELASDKYLVSRLLTWAFYECDVKMDVWAEWEKIDDNVNCMRLKFTQATDTNLTEYAYSVDELDGIIKRIKDHGIKEADIVMYENDHLLVGNNHNEKRNNFIATYLKDLIAKYCFKANLMGTEDDAVGQFRIEISSYGHDTEYVYWEEYVAPTCATEGLNVKYCRICGQIAEKQVVETNDVHTYCWEGNESTRTLKCKACPYSGITEVCVDGIWGYYDEAKAIAYVEKINKQRENTWVGITDDWGNVVGVIQPPQLTIDATLSKFAKTRVIELIKCDFAYDALLENEAYCNARYYETNNYVRDTIGGVDFYDEKYSKVGVSCFCVDRDDSGVNFLDKYVFEFAE